MLLGHSFGGATVRLLSELLAHGDAEEKRTSDPSPLFLGGMESRIHGIVALASPMNGTTAYDMFDDPSFDPAAIRVPWWSRKLAQWMSKGTKPILDGRDSSDYANFDMHVDNAMAMNRRISTLPSVYYFSVPCSRTARQPDGTHKPRRGMEPLFVMRSYQIGAYKGSTAGGTVIDESWLENDGLVNTVSAMAPAGAPFRALDRALDRERIQPGIWNVCPAVGEDHMWPQGGPMRKHHIKDFYLNLLDMIEGSQEAQAGTAQGCITRNGDLMGKNEAM